MPKIKVTCETCNGAGSLNVMVIDNPSRLLDTECPDCEGTGYLWKTPEGQNEAIWDIAAKALGTMDLKNFYDKFKEYTTDDLSDAFTSKTYCKNEWLKSFKDKIKEYGSGQVWVEDTKPEEKPTANIRCRCRWFTLVTESSRKVVRISCSKQPIRVFSSNQDS